MENKLLMEYTLGIGYLNLLYPYIKHITNRASIEKIKNIVEISIKNIPFFLRGKVTHVIGDYILRDEIGRNRIENVEKILCDVKKCVTKIYQDTLKEWWFAFYTCANKDDWYWMEIVLQQEWESYFNEEEVYVDWINELRINDWRNITKVEDCFAVIESFGNLEKWNKRKSVKANELFKSETVPIVDRNGEVKTVLYVEKPINRIGEEIQEETLKKLWERRFTLNYNANVNNWYRLYYDMRNEEFRKLKQKEDEIFVKKDIKIKEGWKKLKPEQVYAWLHKLIIQSLIGGKINSDE